jgi:hypothetical protein
VMRDGLATSTLPRTVRDAVVFARRLGLRWVWVDALCFIQDSTLDWEAEAARTCNVYQGCFVCVAAKGAFSCEEGLFSVRDPLRHTP